ncbi:phosphoesterase [Halalkaliarchaeum desulfuricum]|uniref:Phosphoesterase n=1 Tax=Halalkaliarchaeum desulfuricum TaxID=2055893 RepID=A0A343TIP0_9EURY|nr:metallophosphoesterase [Halalkaliarchaeum desulfuricum]AUX08962.1 phosphoesterase [Halalkaliarchaeum desulfuricum]
MLTIVSDTHRTEGHGLRDRTLEAVREAELVIHAGDFNREPVLDAFEREASELQGVYGNTDDAAIRERLPEARNVEYAGIRFAVTHTRRGGETALALFGRERDADVVVFGHTHRPTFEAGGPVSLLNPGSHAQPRGNRAAHAELEVTCDALSGKLVTPDGEVFERFRIDPRG